MSKPNQPHGILFKPRFYSDIETILHGEEAAQVMQIATREFLYYVSDLPLGRIEHRDDKINGHNDPWLSEQMRDEVGRLWTKLHAMWPISGGSDGYLMAIFQPWEIDGVTTRLGIYNYLSMTIQPLTIYEFFDMYDPASHEHLPEQFRRFLQPDPYTQLSDLGL